nr:MAG TPA: hypothetical protein [Bacteriophage sp.]
MYIFISSYCIFFPENREFYLKCSENLFIIYYK